MQKYQHANPQCQGKWSFVAKDTLLLSCNPVKNIIETISNGYMPNRENKVIILNQRKLKIGRVVLTRIKKNP